MIYTAIFFSLIVLASMVLANRNKALNERQTRDVPCDVKVTHQRRHHN
jgi:hypothetical protein